MIQPPSRTQHHSVAKMDPSLNRTPTSFAVVGGIILDVELATETPTVTLGTSNICRKAREGPGGVARNLAEALGRLVDPRAGGITLISVVGPDAVGRELITSLAPPTFSDPAHRDWRSRIHVDVLVAPRGVASAMYLSLLDGRGELVVGAATNMAIFHEFLRPEWAVARVTRALSRPSSSAAVAVDTPQFLVMDGNLPPETLSALVSAFRNDNDYRRPRTVFDPISTEQAMKCLAPAAALPGSSRRLVIDCLDMIKPNLTEAVALVTRLHRDGRRSLHSPYLDEGVREACDVQYRGDSEVAAKAAAVAVVANASSTVCSLLTLTGIAVVWCTVGKHGVVVGSRSANSATPRIWWVPAAPLEAGEEIKKVTGAGDTFLAAVLATLHERRDVDPPTRDVLVTAATRGVCAAMLTLLSADASAIADSLDREALDRRVARHTATAVAAGRKLHYELPPRRLELSKL